MLFLPQRRAGAVGITGRAHACAHSCFRGPCCVLRAGVVSAGGSVGVSRETALLWLVPNSHIKQTPGKPKHERDQPECHEASLDTSPPLVLLFLGPLCCDLILKFIRKKNVVFLFFFLFFPFWQKVSHDLMENLGTIYFFSKLSYFHSPVYITINNS